MLPSPFRQTVPALLVGAILTAGIAVAATAPNFGLAPEHALEKQTVMAASVVTPAKAERVADEKAERQETTSEVKASAIDRGQAVHHPGTKSDVLKAWDRMLTASRPASLNDTGAADEHADEDDSRFPEPRRACIHPFELRGSTGFRVIDDYHLAIDGPGRRYYLITFATRCFRLRFSTTIVTVSRFGRICGFAGERIFVGNFGDRQRCFVRSVERVESFEHALYLVEKRNAEREARREERRRRRQERRESDGL